MDLYLSVALYAENLAEMQREKSLAFSKAVFRGLDFSRAHDCSIGAGATTLPLAELAYIVAGSDLSEDLLGKAGENFSSRGYEKKLPRRDPRDAGDPIPAGRAAASFGSGMTTARSTSPS